MPRIRPSAQSARIKHREPFQPFGASVLAEEAQRWFKMPRRRSRAALCRRLREDVAYPVRSIARRAALVKGRAAFMTTCPLCGFGAMNQNRLFHSLISQFQELTVVPLVSEHLVQRPGASRGDSR